MRRQPLLVLLLLLVAGCAGKPNPPDRFLEDGLDSGVDAYADLLWASFRELNGSVVLFMEYQNMDGRIPQFVATFDVEAGGDRQTWFLRNQPNLSRPPAYIDYVIGRVQNNEYVVLQQVCAMTEVTRPPWMIRIEAEHAITGLTVGGQIVGLEIQTSDFEGNAKDSARTDASFSVRGGTNPHGTCPLLAERPE